MRKFLFLFSLVPFLACNSSFQSVIQRGEVATVEFDTTISFEYLHHEIIVPVEINGKTYRFLWDTGAPTGISTELQEELGFQVVRRGELSDSQKNEIPVIFVRVPELTMGGVTFTNHTAFVSDLSMNPLINCLRLDGIIGGNTMRFCRWTLNYQEKTMRMASFPGPGPKEGDWVGDFTYDSDYDMIINIGLDRATASNMIFDTGSNGGVTLPTQTFEKWLSLYAADSVFVYKGFQQSGLVGKPEATTTYGTYVDSVTYGSFLARQIEVKSGSKGLVGNRVLEQFEFTIDPQRKQVYGHPVDYQVEPDETWGMSISWDEAQNHPYVLIVLEGSEAEALGIAPLQVVERVEGVDFTQGASFCDYMQAIFWDDVRYETLEVVLRDSNGSSKTYSLPRQTLFPY